MARTLRVLAGVVVVMILAVPTARPQTPTPFPAGAPGPPGLTPEQLDQMVAPIALYPDALLGQILMAATYPLEVVQADRWRQDPSHAALAGDQLGAALEPQPWDPSVKSLVPFPQVLQLMDRNLQWTEALGDAFLAQPGAVMDAVQRLRLRAQAAGTLVSTPQQLVLTQDQAISIVPASPQIVYVPVYDPTVVYGVWPDPASPPFVLPPAGVIVGGPLIGGIGFGVGAAIVGPLWGWHHWDWRRHRIDIDGPRFHAIDPHRPPPSADTWEHDPAHRHGVPYRDAPTRDRFPHGPASTPDARRGFRGYEPASGPAPQGGPSPAGRGGSAAGAGRAIGGRVIAPAPAPPRPLPPAFESFGRGVDTQVHSERGRASRQPAAPTPMPRAVSPRVAPGRPGAPGGGVRPGGSTPHR